MPSRLPVLHPALTVVCVLMLFSGSGHAAGKSQGFASIIAGATDLNGGVDWLPADRPVGIGGEFGLGWVFVASLNVSYHPLNRASTRFDPFLRVSFMEFTSSEFTARGPGVGGGTYWVKPRFGIQAVRSAFCQVPSTAEFPRMSDPRPVTGAYARESHFVFAVEDPRCN
jgi:hypothetical protein